VASEAEYVEIGVTERCDPAAVRAALDAALPPGLDIVAVVEARSPDFVQRLEASIWQIELPGMGVAEVEIAAQKLLAQGEVTVERLTKNGVRAFDARGPVVSVSVEPGSGCAILRAVVRHATPSVRPDDVLKALRQVAGLVPPAPPRVTRLAQGPLDPVGATVGDPFAHDRAPLAAAKT
jgi:radical SAM-linked protein